MVTPLKFFKVLSLPAEPVADAIYYVKTAPNLVECFVTDDNGTPVPVGGVTIPEGALLIANKLSEFATPEDKVAARQNLELQNIDGGTFN